MKKHDLHRHACKIESAYEKSLTTWAQLDTLYSALSGENPPPQWVILEMLKTCSESLGAQGLTMAEFLDEYHEQNPGK